MSTKGQERAFQVRGTPPQDAAPALFCNFVGLTRLGAEVQFEFIYMDLNQIATTVAQAKSESPDKLAPAIQGQTVAKIVMPISAFSQTEEMFTKVFEAVNKSLRKSREVSNERRSAG